MTLKSRQEGQVESWFVQVRLEVGGEPRSCLIGPLDSWSDARRLARAWEREFGSDTTRLRSAPEMRFDGGRVGRYLFAGDHRQIVPAAASDGEAWVAHPPVQCTG